MTDSRSEDMESGIGSWESGVGSRKREGSVGGVGGVGRWGDGEMGRSYRVLRSRLAYGHKRDHSRSVAQRPRSIA
ncbi:hypothetical protein [Moorena sp. SIO4G3]|uniref:hypothetical protein n=1 Tax=Moorena sp. SIO4G3 TaxID=2607821 RepID=UPI00142C4ECF|nr:hypothetical protein [Moorena sp. SIO4G3]NEO75077.1 hypothetical protein [Moorena sp. SIO4G3]